MNDTTLLLTFDQVPMSLNKALRAHRFKYQKQNQLWRILVQAQLNHDFQDGFIPEEPLRNARISIVRRAWRTLDYDGLVGSMKPVMDALVACGVLADDTYKVTGPWNVTQEFRPKKDGVRLEVRVAYNQDNQVS